MRSKETKVQKRWSMDGTRSVIFGSTWPLPGWTLTRILTQVSIFLSGDQAQNLGIGANQGRTLETGGHHVDTVGRPLVGLIGRRLVQLTAWGNLCARGVSSNSPSYPPKAHTLRSGFGSNNVACNRTDVLGSPNPRHRLDPCSGPRN